MASVLSYGGYTIFGSSNPKNLSEKFSWGGRKVLDYKSSDLSSTGSKEYSFWVKKSEEYGKETSKKFSELSEISSTDTNQSKLRELCGQYLEKPIKEVESNSELIEKVKHWCTIPLSEWDS